jgi:AcrR family transcriptional regulator
MSALESESSGARSLQQRSSLMPPPSQASSKSPSLRKRKHDFVRGVLEDAAFDLFVESGFENVTIEEIGRHAGVSRRTYFRYFKTKEDVVASSVWSFGSDILDQFREQPEDVEPMRALEAAFSSAATKCIERDPRVHRMIGIACQTPQIREKVLYQSSLWAPSLAAELRRRGAFRGDADWCELAASLAIAAFEQAKGRWYRNPQRRFTSHLKTTFRQMRQLAPADK